MSAFPPATQPGQLNPVRTDQGPNELTIVSHSNLFYWWPVWAIGFLFALMSAFSGYVMAIVPAGSEARKAVEVPQNAGEARKLDIIQVKPGKDDKSTHHLLADAEGNLEQPYLHVSGNKNLGIVFCFVVLLVIVITNVPLRGMWSLVVILTAIMLSIIFALADWWRYIFHWLYILDVRISMGGYLLMALALFTVWIIVFVFFDRQIYITFTPGQFKVRTEIGGGEQVYDTMGLTLERQRSDLFRHWIIGLGSGDLIVKTSGAQAHHFDLPNVLFINRKVAQIEEIIKSRRVVKDG
jgi:hypothetical protein